jgi:hypothetical protein
MYVANPNPESLMRQFSGPGPRISSVPQPWVMKVGPNVKVLPGLSPGKMPVAPALPVPKDVPLQPKG